MKRMLCLLGSMVVLSTSSVLGTTTYTITDNNTGKAYTINADNNTETSTEVSTEVNTKISTEDTISNIEFNGGYDMYLDPAEYLDPSPHRTQTTFPRVSDGVGIIDTFMGKSKPYPYNEFQPILDNGLVEAVSVSPSSSTFIADMRIAKLSNEKVSREYYLPTDYHTFVKEMKIRGILVDNLMIRRVMISINRLFFPITLFVTIGYILIKVVKLIESTRKVKAKENKSI